MDTLEKASYLFNLLKETIGADTLLEEIYNGLSSDVTLSVLEYIAKGYEVEYSFEEE